VALRVRAPGGWAGYFDLLALPDAYDAFVKLAPTGKKIPMSDGEPDFAWADRENMVVAAKHGDERFWAVLDWGCAASMNRLARVFTLTSTTGTIAEVGIDDVQYTPTGRLRVATGSVEGDGGLNPPDRPTNANVGQVQPIALRADLAAEPPENRDGGRADAYTLRYGHWLVGLNAHPTRSYTVRTPAGFTSAVDLASGRSYAGPVTIGPRSCVVFWLESATAAAVSPANPLLLTALGTASGVAVGWDAAPGAASYAIQRAGAAGGPWASIATGATGTSYLDRSAPVTSTSWYRVQAIGPRGLASGLSAVTASAAPAGRALDAPWSHADVGAVSVPGTASQDASGFTVQGSGADVWGAADAMHFVFRPLDGDGSITARVVSQDATHEWAKAGVTVRASLDPGAPHALVALTAAHGAQMIWRGAAGGSSSGKSADGYEAPAWVRLERRGATLIGSASADGSTWTELARVELGVPGLVYVGLAVNAHLTTATLGAARFEQVSVSEGP
jgi:hypothetical protein